MHRVDDVALAFEAELHTALGKTQTHKLLYYAQAWHLAWYDEPLFDGEFEAWRKGPVEPGLFGRQNRAGHLLPQLDPRKDERAQQVIQFVVRLYGKLSAKELSDATHAESPYVNARGGLPPEAESDNPISQADMATYYRRLQGSPEEAVRHAVANAAAEGVAFDAAHVQVLEDVARGAVDVDDVVAGIVARWRARASRA